MTTVIKMTVPYLFMNIKVERKTSFRLHDHRGLQSYNCVSNIPFPGFNFTRTAVKEKGRIIMKTTREGKSVKQSFILKRDFDYVTGDLFKTFLSPRTPSRRVKYLDLDNGTLEKEVYSLKKSYYLLIQEQRELIYELNIRSKSKKQHLVVIADSNIPISFDLNIPVVGKFEARLQEKSVKRVLPKIHI